MRLVLIEWEDTFGCSSHWEKIEEPVKGHVLMCRSVGWLLHDGPECKVVVPHMTDPTHETASYQGCGDMTIPTRAVIRIEDLAPAKTRPDKKRTKRRVSAGRVPAV